MKKRIAFIGSGEMAKHIAHYMIEDCQFQVVGYFDDFIPKGTVINNFQILGKTNEIEQSFKNSEFDELVNAIGYTRMAYRKEIYERFFLKFPFATFIHSTCYVDPSAKIGPGTIIFPNCLIYFSAVIEENTFIQVNSVITDSIVKKHSFISASVTVAGRSIIGECCNIGVGTTIINDVNICNDVMTGGGTVVIKDIVSPGLYVGSPARKIKDSF